jgi:DNA-binding SARP family transcriptional activator/TolB-like protein
MFRLKLLGGATLEGPSGPLTGRAAQPRRLALLALLAVAGRQGCSRDRLVGLMWPETEPERGRHLLSQSLYILRQALGGDAIVTSADKVSVSPERLWVDATAFAEAISAEDLEAAVELYGGPFMDGFYLRDANGFSEWVETERQGCAADYGKTLEVLSSRATEAGDFRSAIKWCELLLAHDPFNSRTVQRLMHALDSAGDPANALQCALEHEALLAEQFGLSLPAEVAALADEIKHRSNASARAPAKPVEETPATLRVADPTQAGATDTLRPERRRHPMARGFALGVLIATCLVLARLLFWSDAELPTVTPNAVMVVPFENLTGDPEIDGYVQWATHCVERSLKQVDELRVVRSSETGPVRDSMREIDSLEGRALMAAMASHMRAGYLVEGVAYGTDDTVVVESRLVDASTGEVIVAHQASVARSDPMGAVQSLADSLQVATAAHFGLSGEYLESYGRGQSYEAYQEVQVARSLWWDGGREREAFAHLQRAVEIDSTYDAAIGLSAIWHANFGEFESVSSLVQMLESRMAVIAARQRWQLAVAKALLRRDPSAVINAFRDWRERLPLESSYFHESNGALVAGRPGECIAALDSIPEAAHRYARSRRLWERYADCYHSMGEYGAAIGKAREGLGVLPGDAVLRFEEARARAALGHPEEAVAFANEIKDGEYPPADGETIHQTRFFKHVVDLGLELSAHGHSEAAADVLSFGVESYERQLSVSPSPATRWRLARALYAAERWAEAASAFRDLEPEELMDEPLIMRHNVDVSLLGYKAALAIRLGDEETARRIENDLAQLERPFLWGHAAYWRATMAAVRGDREETVERLAEAMLLGLFPVQWGTEYPKWDYHIDPDFESVRDYKPFQELIAPRG